MKKVFVLPLFLIIVFSIGGTCSIAGEEARENATFVVR